MESPETATHGWLVNWPLAGLCLRVVRIALRQPPGKLQFLPFEAEPVEEKLFVDSELLKHLDCLSASISTTPRQFSPPCKEK